MSFDTAKVQRFSEPAMIYILLLHKKRISFDINQAIVCEHTAFVCENMYYLHFLSQSLSNLVRQFDKLGYA